MKRWSVGQSMSVVLAVVLVYATTVWAAPGGFTGSLRTSGVVLANASPIPDGGTVSSGDTIRTQAASLAVISAPGHGKVEIRASTEAKLLNDRVELGRGAVAASSLPIAVDGYSIEPQGVGQSWFAVAKREGRVLVAAHRGSVRITAPGLAPVVVSEGNFAQQTTGGPADPEPRSEKDKEKAKKDKKKKRGAAAGAAAGGWTIGGLSHAASIALVVGVGAGVAAGAAGIAVAVSDDAPSPSPSR